MSLAMFLFTLFIPTGAAWAEPALGPLVIDFADGPNPVPLYKLNDAQKQRIFQELSSTYGPVENPWAAAECAEWDGMQAVKGSFTTPGAAELLLVFDSTPCTGSQADRHGNAVLFDRNLRILAISDKVKADSIRAKLDIDGDRRDDVITTYSDIHQGFKDTFADTLTFKQGGIFSVNYVNGFVFEGTEATGLPDAHDTAAMFWQDRNNRGVIIQKNYIQNCAGDNCRWTYTSTGPMTDH